MKAAMVPPAPGVTPSNVPIAEPIAVGLNNRFIIAQLGNFSRASRASAFAHGGSLICTSISVTAKRPTMTRSGLMPPNKSGSPKVNRGTPDTGSEPTIENIRPITAANSPLISEPLDKPATTEIPRMPSAKYAGGVNAKATIASGLVATTSTNRPNRPPTSPAISEMPSASPARPWRAIS